MVYKVILDLSLVFYLDKVNGSQDRYNLPPDIR